MKILSDDIELLEKLHSELKLARIKVKKETKTIDGGMGDPMQGMTIALEVFQQAGNALIVIGSIRETIALGNYMKSKIKVELKDGTVISYEEYEKISDEDKSHKIF